MTVGPLAARRGRACQAIVAVLSAPNLTCGPGLVHLGPGGRPMTRATVQAARFLGGLGLGTSTIGEASARRRRG